MTPGTKVRYSAEFLALVRQGRDSEIGQQVGEFVRYAGDRLISVKWPNDPIPGLIFRDHIEPVRESN